MNLKKLNKHCSKLIKYEPKLKNVISDIKYLNKNYV